MIYEGIVIAGGIFAFISAMGIGSNDAANAFATSVGSKALTLKQAVGLAAVFETGGAILMGNHVTDTIRKGIADYECFEDDPQLLAYGCMWVVAAVAGWLFTASYFEMPVSTTHSIVGAIVGFAAVGISVDAVSWSKVGSIVSSWVVSPLMSGTIAFIIFLSVQKLILNTNKPFENAKKYVPGYMFLVGFVIAMVTLLKGLKHIGLSLTFGESLTYSIAIGFGIALIGTFFLRKIENTTQQRGDVTFDGVEKVFAVLMVFTACAMAFAHGSNDVANAVGPLAAIASVVQSGGEIAAKSSMPWWILLLGATGIVAGLATLGYKVIETVGRNITELTPSRGFAAELAAATTVVLASGTGLPISTTHTLVGAVLGVGLARGLSAVDFSVVGRIIVSWVVTLPVGAGLSILFFFTLKGIFL